MIVEEAAHKIQSTMTGEKIAMGIAAEDMAGVMAILAGLYSNRVQAIIREYSCNASDAHVEAGCSLPIDVFLPSALNPVLRIRDYGCGLNADDIRVVYSQYGRSTKKNTNTQVGMMGMGCKSALSYTSQFTVASVKDGRRITVLVSIDENDIGSMQILGDDPTTDANGTEVSIAIRREDIQRCTNEAAGLFKYWEPGTVLVNGSTPEQFTGLALSDNLYLLDNTDQSIIVMGGVPYPHDIPLGAGTTRGRYGQPQFALLAFVSIGSVKPTPSRESLKDGKLTNDTVEGITRDYSSKIVTAIQRQIDQVETAAEAIACAERWRPYIPTTANMAGFTYKGRAIPRLYVTGIVRPAAGPGQRYTHSDEFDISITPNGGYQRISYCNQVKQVEATAWDRKVWVTGFTPEKLTPTHKKKILQWCENAGLTCESFALLPTGAAAPDTFWIDPARIVSYETIKAEKLPKAPRAAQGSSGRIPGSYDIITENGGERGVPGDDIRRDVPLLWVEQGYRSACVSWERPLLALVSKFTVVCLSSNRVAKFVRDAPEAERASDFLHREVAVWITSHSKAERQALYMRTNNFYRQYADLDASNVDDPAIKAAIVTAGTDVQALRDSWSALRYMARVDTLPLEAPDPLSAYPLFNTGMADHEHTYVYLNAAYAAS